MDTSSVPADSAVRSASPESSTKESSADRKSFFGWLRSVMRGRSGDTSLKEALEEALEEVLEEHSHEAQALPAEERSMLRNMVNFGDITVHDIMIPRTDIVAVPSNITLEQLKAHILEQRHTRTPIYHDNLDHVEGFVHVKDMVPMFSGDKSFDLKAVLRPMLFVPPSMKIINLLAKMRHAGSHMAIVVDEYGGTDGLITMEDVVEEIFGEIHDEHDEDEQKGEIVRFSTNEIDVLSRTRIDKIEKELGLNLVTEEKEEEFDTLGGLIFFQLGRVPTKGERITHVSGIQFEILDADLRRIHKIRIHMHPR